MLTSVEVFDAVGNLKALLPVTAILPDSRYVIQNITGLGPVKASINTSPYAVQDGGFFQSARADQRNIVFKIEARPQYTGGEVLGHEALRRDLYSIFPPKGGVTLRFYNSDSRFVDVDIVGFVESVEPDIFAKDPTIQVSIICPKPYFNALTPYQRTGETNLQLLTPYPGDAEAGFKIDMAVYSDLTKVILYNSGVSQPLVMEFPAGGGHLRMGDTLKVSTVQGNKYVKIERGLTVIDGLENITSGSMSMVMHPSVTYVQIDAVPVFGQSSYAPYLFTVVPAYAGL